MSHILGVQRVAVLDDDSVLLSNSIAGSEGMMVDDASRLSISVALCTHNGSSFIDEQVASILAQTILPDEIVLSDDDSCDDTVKRVEGLVSDFSRLHVGAAPLLRVLKNSPALGVRGNFERALSECRGEIIALCDQDDRWYPFKVERALAAFEGRPDLLLVCSDAALIDEHGATLGRSLAETQNLTSAERSHLHDGTGFSVLMRRSVATGATVLFRGSLLREAGKIPNSWLHDEWLAIVAAAVAQIDFIPERLGDYRQHSRNQVGVRKRSRLEMMRRLLEPRESRNSRLLSRALELEERLNFLHLGEALLRDVRSKVEHEQIRKNLPANRLLRMLPLLRENRTGRYDRFGRGRRDVLRDLLQSAR